MTEEIQGNNGPSGPVPGIAAEQSIVAIRFGGRQIGLYRVKRVGEVGMLLSHGGISFPVGTRLDVEDVQRMSRDDRASWLSATVVDNTSNGLRLAWCHPWCHEPSGEFR